MGSTAEKIDYGANQEINQKPDLKDASQLTSEEQYRREIGQIANEASLKCYIDQKSHIEYMEVAGKKEPIPLQPEMLKSILETAQGHFKKAVEVDKLLDDAIKKGIASEDDKKYLIQITSIEDFATDPDKLIKEKIKLKISRMQERKDWYVKMSNHSCVENGKIKTGKGASEYSIKDEKEFMKMKPEEKEDELEKMKESILKAKVYFKETMPKEYEERLAKKNVSKKTRELYQKEFENLKTISQREDYLKKLDSNIKKRHELCERMEKTFKGPELEEYNQRVDGLSSTEIEQLEIKLTGKIDARYEKELGKYMKDEKIIGKETYNQYKTWIKNQNVPSKYDALDRLDSEQMQHRRDLWKQIRSNKTPKNVCVHLESKRDKLGYDKLSKEYERLTGQKTDKVGGSSQDSDSADKELDKITSGTIRSGVKEMTENLKRDKGFSGLKSMSDMLTRFTRNAQSQSFDAKGFQSGLQEKKEDLIIKNTKEEKNEKKDNTSNNITDLQKKMKHSRVGIAGIRNDVGEAGMRPRTDADAIDLTEMVEKRRAENNSRVTNKKSDISAVDKEMENLEKDSSTKVVKLHHFRQVETDCERQTQVRIDDGVDGIRKIISEDNKRNYKSEKDKLSFTAGNEQAQLKLTDIRAMQEYLKKKEEELLKGQDRTM